MVSKIIPLALLAGHVAYGAVVRRHEEQGTQLLQSSSAIPLAPSTSRTTTIRITLTEFVTLAPSAPPGSESSQGGASLASGCSCNEQSPSTLPTNPGFFTPPINATGGYNSLSGTPAFTINSGAPVGPSAPAGASSLQAPSQALSSGAPLPVTTPCSSMDHINGTMSIGTVPLSTGISTLHGRSLPGFVWPSKKPHTTAVVVEPTTPFPPKQSRTAVVVEPTTPHSTAIVVQPITPSIVRRAESTPAPENDVHILPIYEKIPRDVAAPRQLVDGTETFFIIQDHDHTSSSQKPSAKPTNAKQSSSRPAPPKSTVAPAPKPSAAPTPSAVPAPSQSSGLVPQAVFTTVIGQGKHCPYPYPGEHCGKPVTTFMTSTLKEAGASGTSPKPEETGCSDCDTVVASKNSKKYKVVAMSTLVLVVVADMVSSTIAAAATATTGC